MTRMTLEEIIKIPGMACMNGLSFEQRREVLQDMGIEEIKEHIEAESDDHYMKVWKRYEKRMREALGDEAFERKEKSLKREWLFYNKAHHLFGWG